MTAGLAVGVAVGVRVGVRVRVGDLVGVGVLVGVEVGEAIGAVPLAEPRSFTDFEPAGELFVIKILPEETTPPAAGANLTMTLAVAPGIRSVVSPPETTEKGDATEPIVIFNAARPAFLIVKDRVSVTGPF
jgi:hypothetical protein